MRFTIATSVCLTAFVLFTACNNAQEPSTTAPVPVPRALNASYIDDISFSRSKGHLNLVEKLYTEMIERDANLSELENRIGETQSISQEGCKTFETYETNHHGFFDDADQFLHYIKDSTLKASALKILGDFEQDFHDNTKHLASKD